jgi:hypothetical protein
MRRYLPVAVLFLLAPFVGEMLLGATPVTQLGGLIPLSAVYGGGAIVIRELARRRQTGWAGVALLAAAYGIVEEGLAVQSLFNPALFHAGEIGGRALGVNWVWTEWAIGYHVVWSIGIPILLAELLFPARRNAPWLDGPGIFGFGLLYLAGVTAIAAIFRKSVAPDFHAPAALTAGAVVATLALIAVGLGWRGKRDVAQDRSPPGPVPHALLLVVMSFVFAGLWFRLLAIPSAFRDGPLVIVPIILAASIFVGLSAAVGRWATRAAWTDAKWLALASGALAVNAAFGFFVVTAANRIDHLGQGAISIVTCVMLLWFALHLERRARSWRC